MSKILFPLLLILVSLQWGNAQDKNCSRTTSFGEVEICLPPIEGYQESYEYETVKFIADATEMEMNNVLGFYLNDTTYERREDLGKGLLSFDDYFKVYATKQLKDYQADVNLLNEMQTLLSGNFIKKNWDTFAEEIDEIGQGIKVETPTVINSYSVNDHSFTFVMLTKYQASEMESYTMAMTMNGLLINERLVWVAYYLNYKDKETITRLQENSDIIVKRILSANE